MQRLEPCGEEVGKRGVLWGGKGALGEEWGRGGGPWIPVWMLWEQAPACCGCMSELSSSPSSRGPVLCAALAGIGVCVWGPGCGGGCVSDRPGPGGA